MHTGSLIADLGARDSVCMGYLLVPARAEVFTLDYVAKLLCSPFVRIELTQPSVKYFHLDELLGKALVSTLDRGKRSAAKVLASSGARDPMAKVLGLCVTSVEYRGPVGHFALVARPLLCQDPAGGRLFADHPNLTDFPPFQVSPVL